jgi:hypothetical protein
MKFIREIFESSNTQSPQELRKFGFIFAGTLIGLFYLFFPWLAHAAHRPHKILFFASFLLFFAVLWPRGLRPVFFIATVIGTVLGAINSRILLFIVFFVVLTPLAWLRKFSNKNNAMNMPPNSDSYRISCKDRNLVKNMDKAF